METDVAGSGVIIGLVAGAISTSVVDAFMLFFVFAGGLSRPGETVFPPPPIFYIVTPLLVIPLLAGLCIGILVGLVFSYFHQSTDDHVPIRRGFKYGVFLDLPYIVLGLLVAPLLEPFYLAVYFVVASALPVLLFGSSLVWMWNRNWDI